MSIKSHLDLHRIDYRVYEHDETFDAQHLAAALHVPGRNVAKTVLLGANHGFKYFVLVLCASDKVDLKKLAESFGDAAFRLATEQEVAARCPRCEFGVLPPFGSQYCAETLVDKSLAEHEDVFFQGDSHREAIRMRFSDFVKLEHPTIVDAAVRSASAESREHRTAKQS